MKPLNIISFVMTLLAWVISDQGYSQSADGIHYTSLNSAIYLGQYDGSATAADVAKNGDFGLGSEEKLAGEMILLDGKMYSIPSSGKASLMDPSARIPFAAVKFFHTEKTLTVKQTFKTLKQVEAYLDGVIDQNRFAAIKVTAKFSYVKFRSFYKQQKPYVPLKEVAAAMFEHHDFDGTLVGFYTPKAADVLNSPAYHFHVIDPTATTGGHVLECSVDEAKIEIDYATQLSIELPQPETLEHINLNAEVKKSE